MAQPEKEQNNVVPLPTFDPNAVKSLVPATIAEAMRLSEILSKSQFVPKDFRGKPGDILSAIMFGSEIGLKPMQALQNVACINGKPAVWGDAALAVCQNHPDFIDVVESFDPETMTATCIAKRRGRDDKIAHFSKQDAIQARLWNKDKTPWQTYPQVMLKQRARGFALRTQFADALKGLITREEAADYDIEPAQLPAPEKGTRLSSHETAQDGQNLDVPNDGPPSLPDFLNMIMRTKNTVELADVIEENSGIWNELFGDGSPEIERINKAIEQRRKRFAR